MVATKVTTSRANDFIGESDSTIRAAIAFLFGEFKLISIKYNWPQWILKRILIHLIK